MNKMNKSQILCPKCRNNKDFWQTKDKRLKCKNCRFLFVPRDNPFNISNETLRQIIAEFILEHSTNIILQRVKISKYKLLIVLTNLRKMLAESISETFNDDQSLKNEPDYSFLKKPIIGIFSKNEHIFAKILKIEPSELKSFFKEPIKQPEDWMKNFALIYNDSFYRLLPKEKAKVDNLDIFWGYLKRGLFLKAGIRKEKFPLYLAEYVWRFNHRKLTLKEKEDILFKLIFENFENKL